MMSRTMVVIASLTGAFLIYCGGDAANKLLDGQARREGGGDGFVSDARAADSTCCTQPAPVFKTIASGELSQSAATSAVIPTAGYREIVVYVTNRTLTTSCKIGLSDVNYDGGLAYLEFRPDSSTPFGIVGSQSASAGGRFQVNGSDLRLYLDRRSSCSHSGTLAFTVAGVE